MGFNTKKDSPPCSFENPAYLVVLCHVMSCVLLTGECQMQFISPVLVMALRVKSITNHAEFHVSESKYDHQKLLLHLVCVFLVMQSLRPHVKQLINESSLNNQAR